ncbi:MAG: response regulator [Acidobacteria bacterium]|nr:response regulator [Acidobacteriota bacterium]
MVLPDEQWKSREVARLLALVETERRYWQEIVTNLPVPVAILNRSLAVVSANRAFRAVYGVGSGDLNNKRITDLIPAPPLAQSIQAMYETAAIPEPMLFETEAGKRVRVTLQQHRNWDEDAVDALVIIEDVPDEAPFGKLPGAVPAVVWTASVPSLDFTFISSSAEAVTGVPIADWKFYDRIEAADREAVRANYTRAIEDASGGVYSAEFRLAGRPRWFRETVRFQDGVLHGVLTDVTGRRAMDEHLLQTQRVEALAGFSGRAAHDLNNPLMIVNGYGEEVLAAMAESDPHRGDMTQVMDAAQRIAQMAAGLQEFARKPAASGVLSPFPVAAALGEHAGDTPADLAALGDAAVFQALVQAIVNAMEGAPVTIRTGELNVRDLTLGTQQQPVEPGPYVLVRIECAAGESLKRPLFESPHLRPELAKAYRDVESWGGSCWASPGNRVVRILLKRAPVPPKPVSVPVVSKEPRRILVVDDETGIRTLMRKILLRQGYTVFEAGGGPEALKILETQSVDLLLTDVMMPEVTGRELAEKAAALYPGLKVLYVSGFTDETLVETGQYPPGSQLLQKPFTLNSLLRKVSEVLGQ